MKILLLVLLITFNNLLLANDLGKTTYDITCKTCHAPRPAKGIHAPAAFSKKEWDARFKVAAIESQKNPGQFKTPMDYLLHKVSIGKGFMPHSGLCKEANVPKKNCSDKAMIEAINYMAGRDHTN